MSNDNIHVIDCEYIDNDIMTAYLLQESNIGAFIDNNTNKALPFLVNAVNKYKVKELKYIIITHVHLDHAGCTSLLAKTYPNATILCHPEAKQHLIDPTRLIKGVKAVYGEEKYNELYGIIEPIEPHRIRTMNDGEILYLDEKEKKDH